MLINVERLRILAALGIVCFHSLPFWNQWKLIGYSGLPIFLMVFSALIMSHQHHQDLSGFMRKKVSRILLPWGFWSMVYILCKVVKSCVMRQHVVLLPENAYLIGTSLHLWYLPYTFVMSFFIVFIQRVAERFAALPWSLLFAGLGLASFAFSSVVLSRAYLHSPVGQWLFGLPGILLGLAIGHIHRFEDIRKKAVLYFILFSLLLLISWFLYLENITAMTVPYILGLLCVLPCFVWVGKPDNTTLYLSGLTYGVYLIHPLVISIFHFFYEVPSFIMIIEVYILSALIATGLKRSRLCWVV